MTTATPPPTADRPEDLLLRFEGVQQHFGHGGRTVRALAGVDLDVRRGETLGVVGESGCGKSTLARSALLLRRPDAGRVVFDGADTTSFRGRALRTHRRRAQMVYQDPNDSLDPRYPVARSVMEPLLAAGMGRREARDRAREVMIEVGVDPRSLDRHPHEFSGGQRQRIGIARAIAPRPELVVLDEPTSALDVSIQAQILNLLLDLQQRESLTYVFISHNLGVVRHLAQRVAVMYLGRVVEVGDAREVLAHPRHPYTMALLSAVPEPDDVARERIVLGGDPPSPTVVHPGCLFVSRCWMAQDVCRTTPPPLLDRTGSAGRQLSACHFADRVAPPAAVLA